MRARVHAALAGPALVFFAPALFFSRALYVRDNGLYFYPHKALVAAALRSFRLPQWSAAEYGGLPILSDPNYAVFHPLSLTTVLLPMPFGYQVFCFGAALLGVYGAYATGRELRLPVAASVVCAWAYAWSGASITMLESGTGLTVGCVPWIFAGAARLRRTLAARDLLLVAAAAAMLLLIGTPEIAGSAFVLALVVAGWRAAPRFLAGCALGAGIACVQLLPTAEFVRESTRMGGFGPEPAFRLSRIPALVFPLFDGWLDAPGVAYWSFEGTPWLEAVYLGAVVLLLAAFGARKRWTVVLGALVFAAIATTPGFAAARAVLPPLRAIRFGDKFITPLSIAVAIAAGTGYDRIAEGPRWRVAALAASALATAALVAAPLVPLDAFSAQKAECLRTTALSAVPIDLVLCAAALGCLAAGRKRLLLPIVALELGIPAAILDRTIPASDLAPSPLAVRLADAGREYRVDVHSAGLREEELDSGVGSPDWPRSRRLFSLRHFALYDSGSAPDLLLMRGYSGFPSGAMRELFGQGDLSRLAVRYGIEFGSGGPSLYSSLGFRLIGEQGLVRVYRNDRAVPRIRLVPLGSARLISERNEELDIETDASQPAELVVADTMARGWTVSVDGQPATAGKGALRIVDVPAGRHEVRWRYRTPGLALGAVVSALSLALAAVLWRRSKPVLPTREGEPQPGGSPPASFP